MGMWLLTVAAIICGSCWTIVQSSDNEMELRALSKQVTVLLDRRKEDMKSIEENIRKTIFESPEMADIRNEFQNLRQEVERLRSGKIPKPKLENNDIITVKWLYNKVAEMKTEITELQDSLNSSAILQNHERAMTKFNLLKSDILNINSEMESVRRKNAKYEAELQIFSEEFGTMKENWKNTDAMCGETKNQLEAAQTEWNQNRKLGNENDPSIENEIIARPTRHQRIIKHQIVRLEKSSKNLQKENNFLKSKISSMEKEIKILQWKLQSNEKSKEVRKNENEVSPQVKTNLYRKIMNITEQQKINMNSIVNFTKQLSNFDKLHLSILELLENVETIENKVDKNFPDFRREISKIEIQSSEATSAISLLREDQKNIIDSLKAIGFTVSNMQDKTNTDHKKLMEMDSLMKNLVKSATVQTSKLHDHILKEESSSINTNATKATIHLVQELKSFESEYKSIVNKLPKDCGAVEGPGGIYLISPGDGEPILARCENGWTTVQKRYDGSINFNRDWNEYSTGFGSATGENWLGNKNLHHLTQENCSRLQINMRDIYGQYWQANYEDFWVADYDTGFKLYVGRYNGNASDALNYQNLMEFSTVDNDRDISNTHCASNYEGGWWFSHCQHANLNGRYNLGLTWFDSSRNEWIAVSSSEMLVKRRDVC